ncbi:hypothetical protein JXO59_15265 [candidate division KSB1 bacterium]|nr:hypothetical protein [candidate division KSB1 bacterium]
MGKTVLTAAMGIALAEAGYRTIVADADFGGANLHQALGIVNPPVTIRDFLTNKYPDLNDLLLETCFPNLFLLSGAPHAIGLANIKYGVKYRLIRHFRQLLGDYILLDIGAGTAFNELDFFIQAGMGIVVITPEPLAIQNGYNFIKICLFRYLTRHFRKQVQVADIIREHIHIDELSSTPTLRFLTSEVKKLGQEIFQEWQQTINAFRPRIVLNMLETRQDYEEGMASVIAANDILGLQVHHLHHVHYDELLRRAIKEGRPDLLMGREQGAAYDVRQIVQQLFFNKMMVQPRFRHNGTAEGLWHEKQQDHELFCSVRCALWGNCSMQRGGYPCRMRVIGFVNQKESPDNRLRYG